MNTVDIQVKVDEVKIQEQLRQLIDESARHTLLFWDIDDIVKATALGKTTLETSILNHPKMKVLERSRSERGKRIWPVAESAQVIKEIIMKEW